MESDSRRRSAYSRESLSTSSWASLGLQRSRAYCSFSHATATPPTDLDVLAQHVGLDDVGVQRRADLDLLGLLEVGMRAGVRADDEFGQHLVEHRVGVVLDDTEDVETREDGLGQLDILRERNRRVCAVSLAPATRTHCSDP